MVGRFAYDNAGRPVSHKIQGGQEKIHRNRRYEWDVNYRLKKVTNELTRTEITYSYDQFSNLVGAKGNDILTVFRTFDEVGNIYGTKDKSDRSYKEGSRLEASGIDLKEKRNVFQGGYGRLVTKGVEYSYDEEGNLVKKREADGRTWEYAYYGNGMLQKVVRLDKSEVSFKYDAFGRRIEKCITGTGNEKAIRFLWDGNALLHEWEEAADKHRKLHQKIEYQAEYVTKLSGKKEQEAKEKAARGEAVPESLVTWIFQDDFIPRARITKEGYSSIMTDYLGTPTEAYDEAGSLVWKRELDINGKVMPAGKDRYGKTMEEEGETGFIPFRFQGQYEDEETGLYYNRFRYYDPETGQYTQQDPIGLAGGNPTLYGYVYNPLIEIDPWGLNRMPSWMPTRQGYQRHHLIPVSVWEKYPILYDLGISFNNATNMTYLPVAEGIDLANPNSSLHKGWNDAHKLYNKYMEKKIKKLAKMATENNWDESKIQQEIRKLQSNTKSKLKGGIMKCH